MSGSGLPAQHHVRHVLKAASLGCLVVVATFLALAAAAIAPGATPAAALSNCSVASAIDEEEEEFLRLINEYRTQNGLSPFVLSESLSRAAAWKSRHMASNGYFAHEDEGIGRGFADRLRDCGYTFNTWLGENIAAGHEDAAATFEQWRNSSGHDAIMLSDHFSAIGIGRAYQSGSTYAWYWTTDFGGTIEGGGDVSCGGGVDAIDAQLLLQYLAGLSPSLPCAENADVTGDGSIDATDAMLILQYSAGLVANFV